MVKRVFFACLAGVAFACLAGVAIAFILMLGLAATLGVIYLLTMLNEWGGIGAVVVGTYIIVGFLVGVSMVFTESDHV